MEPNFRSIKKSGDTHSITSNEIREITEDSSQRLWLATGGGLCWLDLNSNKIHRFNNKALSEQIIYYVLLQGKNYLWIATKEYVHCLNLQNFSLRSFKVSNEQEYKYQQSANNLFFYNDTSLYISGWDGLYCLNTKTGISNHILKTTYFIDAVCYADNGRLC